MACGLIHEAEASTRLSGVLQAYESSAMAGYLDVYSLLHGPVSVTQQGTFDMAFRLGVKTRPLQLQGAEGSLLAYD